MFSDSASTKSRWTCTPGGAAACTAPCAPASRAGHRAECVDRRAHDVVHAAVEVETRSGAGAGGSAREVGDERGSTPRGTDRDATPGSEAPDSVPKHTSVTSAARRQRAREVVNADLVAARRRRRVARRQHQDRGAGELTPEVYRLRTEGNGSARRSFGHNAPARALLRLIRAAASAAARAGPAGADRRRRRPRARPRRRRLSADDVVPRGAVRARPARGGRDRGCRRRGSSQRSLVVGLCAFGLFAGGRICLDRVGGCTQGGVAWPRTGSCCTGSCSSLVTLRPWSTGPATRSRRDRGVRPALIAAGILLGGVDQRRSGGPVPGRPPRRAGRLSERDGEPVADRHSCPRCTSRPGPMAGLGRAMALTAATVLLEMELLSQSRGAVHRLRGDRARVCPRNAPPLADAVRARGDGRPDGARVRHSSWPCGTPLAPRTWGPRSTTRLGAIALSAAAALVLGLGGGLVGARSRSEVERRPWISRAGNIALACPRRGGYRRGPDRDRQPERLGDARWQDFKTSGYSKVESGHTRFTGGLGSNRYDFYRVALDQFADHPVLGVGGDNFADAYLLHRRTLEAPRHPTALRSDSCRSTALVGTALFLVFLGGIVAAVLRARRRSSVEGAALVAAAFASFAAFFFHALVDWLWAFPALGVLAFAMLGVASRTEEEPVESAPAPAAALPRTGRLRGRDAGGRGEPRPAGGVGPLHGVRVRPLQGGSPDRDRPARACRRPRPPERRAARRRGRHPAAARPSRPCDRRHSGARPGAGPETGSRTWSWAWPSPQPGTPGLRSRA